MRARWRVRIPHKPGPYLITWGDEKLQIEVDQDGCFETNEDRINIPMYFFAKAIDEPRAG